VIVGVFGVGAIGGSIALRGRQNGARVFGYDRDASALEAAKACGAIDEAMDADELRERADVLVIAAHLAPTLAEIARLQSAGGRMPALVTDVASVKVPVARAARGLENFVAGHPMAGTERGGVAAARPDLFEGRTWAYVPSGDAQLDDRACDFISSLGAKPLAVSAEEHDRIVAITSHVPQVVAYCYAQLLTDTEGAERLCGPVARELLRIAKMDPAMWRDVLAANSVNVERDLRSLAAGLEKAGSDLKRDVHR
jgi:prephenate dehydrogenase